MSESVEVDGFKDEDLCKLIFILENEMWNKGVAQGKRRIDLPIDAMERLGFRGFNCFGNNVPVLLKRIKGLHSMLYQTRRDVVFEDLFGVFIFRDISVGVFIPILYGRSLVDPFKFSNLSLQQIEWLCSCENQKKDYLINFCNLFDFAACLFSMNGCGKLPEPALDWLKRARSYILSAAVVLCVTDDKGSVVQNVLFAVEFSMKGALVAAGVGEDELKKDYGHNFMKLAEAVGNFYGEFELSEVIKHVDVLPELILDRYDLDQPDFNEVGSVVMSGQAIVGAVARVLTGVSLLSEFNL